MSPDQERWQRLSPLLDEALELPPEARAAWLDALPARAPDLVDELRTLLASQAAADRARFLTGQAAPALSAEQAGRRVGAYTLLEPLGEGGMGAVWLAERNDGRFEGRAAVKLLHAGLLQRALAERFRREGAILAKLSHPNIARLLDAGLTDDGQPYLVLEHVAGQRIDRACDARQLGVRERIALFAQVLEAVQHAHNRLVVHRDLKPGNVMVDAAGSVKLLDFGIAKLLDTEDAAGAPTALTQDAGRLLTPQYAAPEQRAGEAVTTATDVYALGLLLYELLTGQHPHVDAHGRHDPSARDDAAPASRVVTDLQRRDAAELERCARARATTPSRLSAALAGDLDNILAKALRHDAAERYGTVDALADDLRRHLAGETVSARPDSLGYRLSRFVGRHRAAVATTALSAVAVVVLAGVATWQAGEAKLQRDQALRQADRTRAANEFLDLMVYGTWGDDERITRSEFLKRSEALASGHSPTNPEASAVVLNSLASFHATFGDHDIAKSLLERAVKALGPDADPSWRAQVECNLASMTGQLGQADQARAVLQRWVGTPQIDVPSAVQCEIYLAQLAQTINDPSAALLHAERAHRRLSTLTHPPPLLQGSVHGELGYGYALNSRASEADQHYETALRLHREHGLLANPSAVAILNNWGVAFWSAGDVKRSLEIHDQVIGLAAANSRIADPPLYAVSNRATSLWALGRFDEAAPVIRQAYDLAQRNGSPFWRIQTAITSANIASERRELDRAAGLLAEAEAVAASHPDMADAEGLALARARMEQLAGRPDAALAALAPILSAQPDPSRAGSPVAGALRRRADLRLAGGDARGALSDAQASTLIARRLQAGRPHSLRTGLSQLLAARAHAALGDRDAARSAASEALDHLGAMFDAAHPDLAVARQLAQR